MRLRSSLIALLLGLSLLLGVVGFAVGLPQLTKQNEEQASVGALLPESLREGNLRPLGEVVPDFAGVNEEQQDLIAARQSRIYGADYAIRYYAADASLSVLGAVTVLDREPSLFQPGGPPVELAEGQSPAGAPMQVAYGDVVCHEQWGPQATLGAGVPTSVQCQRGDRGRTFEVFFAGMTSEVAASVLNEVVAHARTVEAD
jgi:hypothetical protein